MVGTLRYVLLNLALFLILFLLATCRNLLENPWSPLSMPTNSSVFAQARPPQRDQLPIISQTMLKSVIAAQIQSNVDTMQARRSESRGLCPAALRLVHTPSRGGQGLLKARGRGSGTSSKHIQLNQDLIAAAKSGDDEQLCALVKARLQDFNAVNAATAFQKLLLMRIARDTRRQQTLIGPNLLRPSLQSAGPTLSLRPGLVRYRAHLYDHRAPASNTLGSTNTLDSTLLGSWGECSW